MDETKDMIFYIENLIIVDKPIKLTKITRQTRESVYYLESLLNHNTIYKGFIKEEKSEYKVLAEKYLQEFKEIENKLYFKNDKQKPLQGIEYTNTIKKYITLKQDIDQLQINMIDEMVNIATKTIEKLLENQNLSHYSLEIKASILSTIAFKRSHKENKICTYLFLEKDQKYDDKIDFDKYDKIKVDDHSFILKRNRENLQYIFNKLTSVILQINENEEKKELKQLNIKQFKFNQQVTIITWIVGCATIIMLILSFIQFFNNLK